MKEKLLNFIKSKEECIGKKKEDVKVKLEDINMIFDIFNKTLDLYIDENTKEPVYELEFDKFKKYNYNSNTIVEAVKGIRIYKIEYDDLHNKISILYEIDTDRLRPGLILLLRNIIFNSDLTKQFVSKFDYIENANMTYIDSMLTYYKTYHLNIEGVLK